MEHRLDDLPSRYVSNVIYFHWVYSVVRFLINIVRNCLYTLRKSKIKSHKQIITTTFVENFQPFLFLFLNFNLIFVFLNLTPAWL